eukprot:scaffold178539_cov15-Prasinocladus_malaysianus.AAC.1
MKRTSSKSTTSDNTTDDVYSTVDGGRCIGHIAISLYTDCCLQCQAIYMLSARNFLPSSSCARALSVYALYLLGDTSSLAKAGEHASPRTPRITHHPGHAAFQRPGRYNRNLHAMQVIISKPIVRKFPELACVISFEAPV